jgi:hypothetical protein
LYPQDCGENSRIEEEALGAGSLALNRGGIFTYLLQTIKGSAEIMKVHFVEFH